jgi:glucosamine--fructose-6-phosphate aminotransferase (isomerizing)
MIIISQSGETKDLYRCVKIAKEFDVFTIGVINVRNSLLAREVCCGCYLNVGREVAVASTKSFTSQVLVLSLISMWFYNKEHNAFIPKSVESDILKLTRNVKETLKLHSEIKKLTGIFENVSSMFILATNKCYPIASEGALKIKELSYIHAEDYPLGSLKHGPFALLSKNTVVILLSIGETNKTRIINCYNEVKSRGVEIIVISDLINDLEWDHFITIPTNNTYSELLCTIPLQLLAYELSISRGINPDIPRNLAKVVTVD